MTADEMKQHWLAGVSDVLCGRSEHAGSVEETHGQEEEGEDELKDDEPEGGHVMDLRVKCCDQRVWSQNDVYV